MLRSSFATLLVICLAAPAAAQGMFVYPQRDQSAETQQADEYECQSWARSRTGYDPMAGRSQGASVGGTAARTGAKGAAVGATVGVLTGRSRGRGKSAARGAGVGAVAGGMVGGMSARGHNRQQDQAEAAHRDQFMRAYVACLEGRGYTVR